MSELAEKWGRDAGYPWSYTTEHATPETKKIIEQNEQMIAELKSIAANMNRIAAIIHTRFGELEQSQ